MNARSTRGTSARSLFRLQNPTLGCLQPWMP